MSGWGVGWGDKWGGDETCPSILLIFKYVNKQDVLITNMVSKLVYGFCIKGYERVSSFSNLNKNFKEFFPVTFALFNFFS